MSLYYEGVPHNADAHILSLAHILQLYLWGGNGWQEQEKAKTTLLAKNRPLFPFL